MGNPEDFWEPARGFYDIHNYRQYQQWGKFLTNSSADADVAELEKFRAEMIRHGEGDKPYWVTEVGWWGTGSRSTTRPTPGKDILTDPIVLREDALRADWLKEMFLRLLAMPGCQKVFLWVAMDEFDGGWAPDKLFGRGTPEQPASGVSLWGIFAGDRSWRKSAYSLQEMMSR